jgi:hypothetical protein
LAVNVIVDPNAGLAGDGVTVTAALIPCTVIDPDPDVATYFASPEYEAVAVKFPNAGLVTTQVAVLEFELPAMTVDVAHAGVPVGPAKVHDAVPVGASAWIGPEIVAVKVTGEPATALAGVAETVTVGVNACTTNAGSTTTTPRLSVTPLGDVATRLSS